VLNENQKQQLQTIAKESIKHGLDTGEPVDIELSMYDKDLQNKRATFVTLHKHHQLRGCIGILEPLRPLAEDIAYNAFAAAFSDSRFPAVTPDEVELLDITSEDDLVSQLRPGIDGLIMQEGNQRGTFLPSVWESLTDKHDFLRHLKQKSGLAANYWSDTIRVQRYTVEEF